MPLSRPYTFISSGKSLKAFMYGIWSSSTNLHFFRKNISMKAVHLFWVNSFWKSTPFTREGRINSVNSTPYILKATVPWRRPDSWLSTDTLTLINALCLRSIDLPAHHQAPQPSFHVWLAPAHPVNPFFRKLFFGPCFLVSLLSSGPAQCMLANEQTIKVFIPMLFTQ